MELTFALDPAALAALATAAHARVERAATVAMRETMALAADWARRDHQGLAGWKNESGNLERSITGYVAGDPPDEVYPYGGSVPLAPFRKGNRVVRSQTYLNDHYRVDEAASPPVDAVPDKVIGVLHHFMQYSNRLPFATGQPDIAVAALEAHAGELETALATTFARALAQGD